MFYTPMNRIPPLLLVSPPAEILPHHWALGWPLSLIVHINSHKKRSAFVDTVLYREFIVY